MRDRYDWESKVRHNGRWIGADEYRRIKRRLPVRLLAFSLAFLVYWFLILPAVARIVERWVG